MATITNTTIDSAIASAASATVAAGGSGYAVDDILTLSGGTFADAATFRVLTLSGSAVATVALENAGGDYSVLPSNPVSTTGGGGTGCTLTVDWNAAAIHFLSAVGANEFVNNVISNNLYGIELSVAGTYEFEGCTFSGNTADIQFTNSSGNIIVNISGGGDIPTSQDDTTGSGTFEINNNVTLTLSGLQPNTEVRIYQNGATGPGADGDEIGGIENSVGTTFDFVYDYADAAADFDIDIILHHLTYKWQKIEALTVSNVDVTIPVQQVFDRDYQNP